MKIIVLGANGMAGHMVARYLTHRGYEVITSAREDSDFDIDVEQEIDDLVFAEFLSSADYVVNCVGLLVKPCLDRPDRAIRINSWFPHYVEHLLADTNTPLIHLSTDCVFDGKQGSYFENSPHTETNFYGRSKSLGEINNNKDITFRMSIIGPELKLDGTGLFNWFVNHSDANPQGWDNAWWNGITTLELAKCIEQYITGSNETGIYHLVNNANRINKYDLLEKINKTFNLNKQIQRTQGPKPVNKILVDTRGTFKHNIPDYNTQLEELKSAISSDWYS